MKFTPVFVSIIIAQTAGIVGSVFTANSVATWYVELTKPSWGPPNWIFGPVWITLYTVMGIAAYLVWLRRKELGAKIALSLYGAHLVLNAAWSLVFFGLKNPGLAFAEILVLLISIVTTTVLFWRISRPAGALMIPYLAWVSFASYLNYAIWQLN